MSSGTQTLIFVIGEKVPTVHDRFHAHPVVVDDHDVISLHICFAVPRKDGPCEWGRGHVCRVKTGDATAGGNRRQSPRTTSSLITAHPLIFISRQTDIWNTSGSAASGLFFSLYNPGNLCFIKHVWISDKKNNILGIVFWCQATGFSHIMNFVSSLSFGAKLQCNICLWFMNFMWYILLWPLLHKPTKTRGLPAEQQLFISWGSHLSLHLAIWLLRQDLLVFM